MLVPWGILGGGAFLGAGYTFEGFTAVKFLFETETETTTNSLSQQTSMGVGFSNTNVAGYIAGGQGGVPTVRYSKIEKITFPTDSVSIISATLSNLRNDPTSVVNTNTAGYVNGGQNANTNTYITSIDKLTFSSDSRTTISATLSNARFRGAGFSNTNVAGYIAGGLPDGVNFPVNSIDKLLFSNETKSTLGATTSLGVESTYMAGLSNSNVAGYLAGGGNGTYETTLDKLSFSTETRSTNSSWLSSGKRLMSPLGSKLYGYFKSADTASFRSLVTEKLDYANDTRSTINTTSNVLAGLQSFTDSGSV